MMFMGIIGISFHQIILTAVSCTKRNGDHTVDKGVIRVGALDCSVEPADQIKVQHLMEYEKLLILRMVP